MKVELHIEKLILHGSERVDRATLGPALQAELGRLLRERGLPRPLRQPTQLDRLATALPAGSLPRGTSASASRSLGRKIAGAAYKAMSRPPASKNGGSRE